MLFSSIAQYNSAYTNSEFVKLYLTAISAFEVQPLSTEVQEGGVARFACKISSNPPAVITWELNRTTVPITMDR